MNCNRFTIRLGALAIFLVLVLCGVAQSQEVRTNVMPGTDFSKYHTYKWVTMKENAHPDQIVDAEIKEAVDAQLAAKGFTKTNSDNADMFVGYQTSVDKERQWNTFGSGGVFWGGMQTTTTSTIQVGTIAVDIYDPTQKQLIWRGQATKTLDPSKSQEKNQKNLDKAMEKLFKNFPPK
jgi:Domain of unknown function (DUF4136)